MAFFLLVTHYVLLYKKRLLLDLIHVDQTEKQLAYQYSKWIL